MAFAARSATYLSRLIEAEDKFLKAMAKVPHVEPEEHDKL